MAVMITVGQQLRRHEEYGGGDDVYAPRFPRHDEHGGGGGGGVVMMFMLSNFHFTRKAGHQQSQGLLWSSLEYSRAR